MRQIRCSKCGRLYADDRTDCEGCGALYEQKPVETLSVSAYGPTASVYAGYPTGQWWEALEASIEQQDRRDGEAE